MDISMEYMMRPEIYFHPHVGNDGYCDGIHDTFLIFWS